MNNIFCRAPFMHSYIGYAGRPRLCCASIPNKKIKTLHKIEAGEELTLKYSLYNMCDYL